MRNPLLAERAAALTASPPEIGSTVYVKPLDCETERWPWMPARVVKVVSTVTAHARTFSFCALVEGAREPVERDQGDLGRYWNHDGKDGAS